MNSTLEAIHSRITEAEEWINDLEDRMVEITARKQNIEKKKKRKEMMIAYKASGTALNAPIFAF